MMPDLDHQDPTSIHPLRDHIHGQVSLDEVGPDHDSVAAHQRTQNREDFNSLEVTERGFENSSDEDDEDDEDDNEDALSPLASEDDDDFTALGLRFQLPNASHRGASIDEKPNGRGTGTTRGPRKAAEPTGDVKLRLSQATEAFISEDYLTAREIISEVIRINAETYEAWIIMSSIDRELGDIISSVNSFAFAQNLRPKDVEGWMKAANYALAQSGGPRVVFLDTAFYCFSSAIRANVGCIEARIGKAEVKVERGNLTGAISDYKRIFKYSPYNLDAVRNLGAVYFDLNEVESAKQLYKSTFDHLKSTSNLSQQVMDWNDVASYVALFEHQKLFQQAIVELRSLARWLLGRESEDSFDAVISNDCEWDEGHSRRADLPGFIKGLFPLELYGAGLPIALRVKMGICRLKLGQNEEAIRHLDHLGIWDKADESWITENQRFYLEAAENLMAAGLFQNALSFYQALKRVPRLATASVYIQMAKCFQGNSLDFKAEECFQTAIQVDDDNVEARVELAKMYEALNQQEQAFVFVNEAILVERRNQPQTLSLPTPRRRYKRKGDPPRPPPERTQEPSFMTTKRPRTYKPSRLTDPKERQKEAEDRAQQLQRRYLTLETERVGMMYGDNVSTRAWMDAAKDLTDDFRAFKGFYTWEKFARFLGYKKDVRGQVELSINPQLTTMADKLSQNLGGDVSDELKAQAVKTPSDYQGISFNIWLDIFLEYALCLARNGKGEESYEICEAAKDSNIYSHSPEDVFLIHICWCACAILTGDESTCVSVGRNFMKDYSSASNSYRMFAAVTRMCNSPIHLYRGDTSHKFLLRQIKAIDSTLTDDYLHGTGSSIARHADDIANPDIKIALLMLYGHILHAGQSYQQALNYFLRALALEPDNPLIKLNIGLTYAHQALKREAENRQYLILQGTAFLFAYYDSRKASVYPEERTESHYNMGRFYHLLGLSHLAVPYYLLVLEGSERKAQGEALSEDLVTDAAYNLQTIYTTAGNHELANAVTESFLLLE